MKVPKTLPGEPVSLTLSSRGYNRFSKIVRRFPYAPSSHPYNLTVCHQRRFIWFRVAKTGTRSLLKILKDAGLHLDAEHPMNVHYPVGLYADYIKFSFVRNPWDRLVSCWNNKIVDNNWWGLPPEQLRRLQQFDQFVDYAAAMDLETCDTHLRLQSSVIDLNHIDYLGRFETYADDLDQVLALIGLPAQRAPRLNASRDRADYRSYYDDALAEKVGRLYRKDVQIFNYAF